MARHGKLIAGIVTVAVVTGTVAAGVYAWNHAAGWLESWAGDALGRETSIGSVHVDWAWTPTIRLTDVSVDNAAWGEAEHLLTAREIRFHVRLAPLLKGTVDLPRVVIDKGALALERNADGDVNWDLGGNSEEPGASPKIGRLEFADGTLSVRDAMRELAVDGSMKTADPEDGGQNLELALEGSLADKPLKLDLTGGAVLSLRSADQPYPVDLELAFGDTRLRVNGKLQDPLALAGVDVQLALSGPNLADVYPLFRIPAPTTPPYDLEGRLRREGEKWTFSEMSGHVGDSDLAGDISVDTAPKPAFLKATLVSENLHFKDLASLVGVPPDGGDEKATGQLFPDAPLKVDRLHAMDMDVSLRSDRVEAPSFLPVTSLDIRVVVEAGRAEANPLRLGIAGGTVQGSMALNARTEVPSADADLRFEQLDLAAFFKGSDYYDTMGGKVQGRLYLLGSGGSLAEVMGTASGNAAFAMTGGAISGLLIEGAGVDLAEALVLVVGEDAKVPIRCAMARMEVENGRAKIERAVMDTTDSVLYISGAANLQKQTVNLDIEAKAKDFSLLDVDAPVHIEGKIANPDISLGEGSPIPFLDLGEGEDVPCDRLIKEYLKPPDRK